MLLVRSAHREKKIKQRTGKDESEVVGGLDKRRHVLEQVPLFHRVAALLAPLMQCQLLLSLHTAKKGRTAYWNRSHIACLRL